MRHNWWLGELDLTEEPPVGQERTMTPEKILYTVKAHTTGGRDGGASHSDDGRLDAAELRAVFKSSR